MTGVLYLDDVVQSRVREVDGERMKDGGRERRKFFSANSSWVVGESLRQEEGKCFLFVFPLKF